MFPPTLNLEQHVRLSHLRLCYFGDTVNFSTLEEHQARIERKVRGEPERKAPPKKSNDLDVILTVRTNNASATMPANIYQSLLRVYNSIAEQQSMSAQEWIGSLKLVTNVVSKNIFGFYHATCSKKSLLSRFKSYWFHPFMESLMRAAFRETQAGELITEKLIDGREWVYKISYPTDAGVDEDQLGGVFTDSEAEGFVSYTTLCSDHLDLFKPKQ